jgi:hypothetical protein
MGQSQPRQIVHQDPILEKKITKRAGGVVQGVVPKFKLLYQKKERRNYNWF